ncbi:MAG: LEA type 2 family protein [Vicingaceae bacterium]
MSLLKGALFVIATCLLLSSCVNYDKVEIKEIKEVNLVNFSDEGLIVDSKVKISNPNAFDIKVVDSKLDIIVQGRPIGSAKIDGKLILPSKSEAFHTLRLKSNFDDLGKNALVNLLAITASNNNQIDFKFEGYIVCKVFIFKRKVEISHEDSTLLKL